MTKTQEAMRRLFKIQNDRAGNLPSLPDIFPDELAPVVSNAKNGERSLELMRWGFPASEKPDDLAPSRLSISQGRAFDGWL